ncbi:hypothetical protein [uncultured Bdellovibrio sp.]|uniref:hypothetical protein n=1 Tax=Bdellovibrio sp. HCB-162 TaxID=3394234 RepID=UPI0025DE5F28|nr:hypothetical protein [uncultured Bdellovibrio sp.]
MKKNTLILLIVGAAVILIISYCQFWSGGEKNPTAVVDPETMGNVPPESSSAAAGKPKGEVPPPSEQAAAPSAGFLPTQMEDAGKFEAYKKHLKEMAVCLNMQVGQLDPQSEINFETFNKAISPDLGDIVMTTDEWSATDIRTKAGELRRIYIENSPDPEKQSQKNLKYYSLSTSGEQKELPLAADQMANPSEALIASLESDGELVGKSTSRRMFYQNGDDLLLIERNGKIYSFELPHDGKTFTCIDADSAKMACRCK